ncbi:MAG: acetyl-CoA carboxylase biotin carboxyl carrier protein, partial [Lachnospiraceae bacterium]|nr:acetyl-CoA carboxylase biotin carboxyl carrier protein [Lachnospiraceae bacterium]
AAADQAGGIASDQVVTSPLVGVFYSASSPDADPFVKVGDRVKKGQVLGIIEAMKLMNEIESEYDGVVEAILVKNEDVVEYGQPLFRIR